MTQAMKDIQGQPDHRRIPIRKVGVKEITYPITVLDRDRQTQKTVAKVNMYVNLPHHFKGTHMSRFIEILNRFRGEVNLAGFHRILSEMKEHLHAESAHVEMDFPYFVKRPQQSSIGISEYRCTMHGSLGEEDDLVLTLEVPIFPPQPAQAASGMPRSLGKWGRALISLSFSSFIWIEDLIEIVEKVTCHDLAWPEGERDTGYPLTVERLAKNLGHELSRHREIRSFSLRVENFAHGHTTFATLKSEHPRSN